MKAYGSSEVVPDLVVKAKSCLTPPIQITKATPQPFGLKNHPLKKGHFYISALNRRVTPLDQPIGTMNPNFQKSIKGFP